MKHLNLLLLGVGISMGMGLTGCGKEKSTGVGPSYRLSIDLPQAVSRKSNRYEAFRRRLLHLQVDGQSKSGLKFSQKILGSELDSFHQVALPFPGAKDLKGDRLELKVQAWDTTRSGKPRASPAAVGTLSLRAEDVDPDRVNELKVRLRLRIPVADYD